jgi:prevent-host-death family protein
MKQVNLSQAKANSSHLVAEAARGKGVNIAKSGAPVAKLVPLDKKRPKSVKSQGLKNLLSGRFPEMPDDFLDAIVRDRAK